MIGIYFSLLLFFVCFIAHVFLHRMSSFLNMKKTHTVGVYVVGFALLLLGVKLGGFILPLTSLSLFFFPSLFVAYFYLGLYNAKGEIK
ncbi:MAG: hypothetical protein AAB508_03370 [Patescibacteria group bacterium]